MKSNLLVLALLPTLLLARSADKKPDPVNELAAKLEPSRKVVYKTTPTRPLNLHVFEPDGFKVTDKRPVFVAIHGGGWVGMGPERFYPFAAHFAKLGMLGISVEYRLASKKAGEGTTVFECVKDARSAIRYIRSHAAELGADPDRVVVCGGSAGGHLTVATALFDQVNEAGEDTAVSCVPNALKVYFALAHPGRRRLLESLAQQRTCVAAQAGAGGGLLKRDSTSKQLQELVKAGLATMMRDEKDGRRQRYTLLPGLTAAKNAQGQWEMDLGCCVMRW